MVKNRIPSRCRFEVQRLEGLVADLCFQHGASLSERERAEEVSFRISELESLYDQLADLKDFIDNRLFYSEMGEIMWRRDRARIRSLENLVAHEHSLVRELLSREET